MAEVESLQAKVNELQETLAQANRDVNDCVLRAPFRGRSPEGGTGGGKSSGEGL